MLVKDGPNVLPQRHIVKSSGHDTFAFMTQIANALHTVLAQIQSATEKAGRAAGSARLVAVSKTHPAEAVAEALAAGQRVFGENRVQEAAEKFPALRKAYPDLELHLIGPLQTNKVDQAVALFDVIQTLDRPKLAQALAKEIEKQGRSPRLYIEVNTGAEPQKAGVSPAETEAFLRDCRETYGLKIAGLMCIPPFDQDPAPHFNLLAKLGKKLGLPTLSMGMSADYEAAIAAGATEVRVGTAIFGVRETTA